MSALSAYLENALLNHVLGNSAFSAPANIHVALFTALPAESGSGGTEVTGGSYARVSVTNNTTNFPAASGGTKSNGTAITFPTATADWGTVVGFGLYDASSGGNMLFFGALTTSRAVLNGDTFRFNATGLAISLD